MRILVLNESDYYCLGPSYLRAFRELGHEVNLHDPTAELAQWSAWRVRLFRRVLERPLLMLYSRRLIRRLLLLSSDLIWVGKGAWALPWVWREFKRQRPAVALVCYNADNPIVTYSRGGNRPWVTAAIPCFDLYVTYNHQLLDPLRQAGARAVLRLPFAWDPAVHPLLEVPEPDRLSYASDVVFVGNGDATRERWLHDILLEARNADWNMAVYGAWSGCRSAFVKRAIRSTALYGEEMVKAIRSAKLAINILRDQNTGSHNMRTFEIPGCGGILVSQHSPEQKEFFPDGQAAVYFSDAQNAVARITALLKNGPQQDELRFRAAQIVRRHTYVDRARALLEAVKALPITA